MLEEKNASGKNCRRFYRSNVLNQVKGLTLFIKAVEEQAKREGVRFDITSANIKNVVPCKCVDTGGFTTEQIPEEDKTFKAFTWFSFIYNDAYFYFQIDDNPFFDHYYSKIKFEEDTKHGLFYTGYKYLHKMRPLDNIDVKLLFGYETDAPQKICNNLLNIFNNSEWCATYRGRRNDTTPHITKIERNYYFDI